ncbi:MAG: DUF2892 domain-containing protein [Chitinophagaceae bacterium]|nr:DUF2892 domain-containing protein [Chitinophagaceae bacterium]
MNENAAVGPKLSVNVNSWERVASVAVGALLAIDGLRNKNKSGLIKAAAGGYLMFRGASGHCPVYSVAGKHHLPDPAKNINIRTTLYVNRPSKEVYNFWRNLSNLPLFMQHIKSIKNIDETRSKWKASLPGHLGSIKWKAEIVKDEPGRLIGWNSLPGSMVENAGKVEFRQTDNGGTELRVVITYRAPLGVIGAGIAKLFTPTFEKMIENDIQSFKSYIETGVRPETKNLSKAIL